GWVWPRIENAREEWFELNSVHPKNAVTNHDIEKRLGEIEKAATALLQAARLDGIPSVLAWDAMALNGMSHDECFPPVERLARVVRIAKHKTQKNTRANIQKRPLSPRDIFVGRLAAIFQTCGLKPTAPKPPDREAPKPSRFVKFVIAVSATL